MEGPGGVSAELRSTSKWRPPPSPRTENFPFQNNTSQRGTMPRTCETCGVKLERREHPNGRLEGLGAFNKRRFCSLSCSNTRREDTKARKMAEVAQQADKPVLESCENLTPLEFLLSVMRNPNEPIWRRVKCAIALLPYCHVKAGYKVSKKERQLQAAKEASAGFFRPMRPPARACENLTFAGWGRSARLYSD